MSSSASHKRVGTMIDIAQAPTDPFPAGPRCLDHEEPTPPFARDLLGQCSLATWAVTVWGERMT